MRAYFHTFTPTGCDAVDAILEAVALAGKANHYTGDWGDDESLGPCGHWTLIQVRANEAADRLSTLTAQGGDAVTEAIEHLQDALAIGCGKAEADVIAAHDTLALSRTTPPAPSSNGITAEWVTGYLMAPIGNPEAWPENYANGFNDCAKTCAKQVGVAFAEWNALNVTHAPSSSAVEGLVGKWRNEARTEADTGKDKNWAEWVRERHMGAAASLWKCADELEQALASTAASGGECQHEWQPDAHVEGASYCRRCDVTRRTAAPAMPEYETRIGEAGQRYIESVALNKTHTLPAQFRWHELWEAMLAAASAQGDGDGK